MIKIKENTTNKVLYYDFLRTFACFLVIVNHTVSFIFLSTKPSPTWYLSITYFFVSKAAVPIFVMLSGALLLRKDYTYKQLFSKKILRIILTIIVFSFTYQFIFVENFNLFNPIVFLGKIIKEPVTIPYWYLYMLLGLYIMTPMIRKMIKNFNYKDFIYFNVVFIIFSGIYPLVTLYFPTIQYSRFFTIPIFSTYIGYFILGYFIDNIKIPQKKYKKAMIILSVLFIFSLAIQVILTSREYYSHGQVILKLDNVGLATIMSLAIPMFFLFKHIFSNIVFSDRIQSILSSISSATFGIYLLHNMLIIRLDNVASFLNNNLNWLLACLVFQLLIFIACFIITKILQKIPLIKKLL
ncbi:hypothetical protein CLPU_8c00970 [Gottschalkia purinilytica]|uniref:Acyltransferase 3 domain-containing protein n=1 Tax=Gottschalkia purinilytica TaxID=1503 RepID=A0A0L0WA80_GOTPU|nr:acyltransferase family protein [Gottschalkia purinilytica]KNF08332.1 hypothetical protein CLPU_8c00970 [Gottschalkia purinilytica]